MKQVTVCQAVRQQAQPPVQPPAQPLVQPPAPLPAQPPSPRAQVRHN